MDWLILVAPFASGGLAGYILNFILKSRKETTNALTVMIKLLSEDNTRQNHEILELRERMKALENENFFMRKNCKCGLFLNRNDDMING